MSVGPELSRMRPLAAAAIRARASRELGTAGVYRVGMLRKIVRPLCPRRILLTVVLVPTLHSRR